MLKLVRGILLSTLQKKHFAFIGTTVNAQVRLASLSTEASEDSEEFDQLFPRVSLEIRGHDPAVLNSYTSFLRNTCEHLSIKHDPVQVLRYVRWVQPVLRSKFVHKKYKLHYETRTHIRQFTVKEVTGSTASTFLEYIERNIPEGVAMKVSYEHALPLPPMIKETMKKHAARSE
ncbi:hypothetical protein AB6A40_005630 [Gnathostoma spinigerum]|uniref:Small ribosomal subunit protein uS10m n=1 Tax=Gnathostoma spinigerum TaxID=75299 RepID=A0ABD6EGS9_9BILA